MTVLSIEAAQKLATQSRNGEVQIPEGVTEIHEHAFNSQTTVTAVNFNGSVTKIGRFAFAQCTAVNSFKIPVGITEIEDHAFQGCTSITSCEFEPLTALSEIEDFSFQGCTSLTSVTIPKSVTIIGEGAFQGCTSLKSVLIHVGVTKIGEGAFQGCGLTLVRIPSQSTKISNDAFDSNCVVEQLSHHSREDCCC